MTNLTYGSTFSGIGGFDLGFDQAGLQCAWQVENDKDCNRVLRRHWPETKRESDIEDFEIYGGHERPDIICGGFPCQDLSVAGRRAGLVGKRSGLFWQFHRIIAEFKPRGFVLENVPGLFSSHSGSDFLSVIRGMEELGYCVAWTVLDSQYRGVPQRRDRLFIVGSLGNGSCAQVLFEPESVRGDTPPRRETGTIAANALGRGFGDRGGASGKIDAAQGNHLIAARMTAFGEYVDDDTSSLKERDYKDATDLVAFTCKDSGQDCESGMSPTLRSMPHDKTWSNGGGQVAVAFQSRIGRNGRGQPDKLVPALGNAVTVPVAQWIGQQLQLHLA